MLALGNVDLTLLIERLYAAPIEALIDVMRAAGISVEVGFTAFWETGPAKDAAMAWFTSERTVERFIAFGSGTDGTDQQRMAAWSLAALAMEH